MRDQKIPNCVNAVTASLLQVLRSKEPGVFEHSLRVGELSLQLAHKLGMSEYQKKVTEIAALLHDLGEVTIDQDILSKPTKLNAIEYEIMKSHVQASVDFLKPLTSIDPFFVDVLDAVKSHHENVNGTGYPNKLKAEKIPLIGRIISLIDAFDSMTTQRVYRDALSIQQAYGELEKMAGIQFDRQLVSIFMLSYKSFKVSSVLELESYIYGQAA